MVGIRNFNNNDVKFIYDNWAENINWGGCKFDKDKLEILSQINEFNLKKFNNKYFEQFVIVYNNILVGMISLLEKTKSEVCVNIYVHEPYRRKGFATKAYRLIEDIAKQKKYKILSAYVAQENHISKNMHIKFNFSKVNEVVNKFGENQVKYIKEL